MSKYGTIFPEITSSIVVPPKIKSTVPIKKLEMAFDRRTKRRLYIGVSIRYMESIFPFLEITFITHQDFDNNKPFEKQMSIIPKTSKKKPPFFFDVNLLR